MHNILKLSIGLFISFVLSLIFFFLKFEINDYQYLLSSIVILFIIWFIYVISEILLIKYDKIMKSEFNDKFDRNTVKTILIDDDKDTNYNGDILYIWNHILELWKSNKKYYKKKSTPSRVFFFYLGYILICTFLIIFSIYLTSISSIGFDYNNFSIFSPLTIILLSVSITEFILFLWCSFQIKFPEKKEKSDTSLTCLLIACHNSCYTPERVSQFQNTLNHALKLFKPENIFVCDNGNNLSPTDFTQNITYKINNKINYVYIPEGNKTHALYWVTEHWIPHLQRWNKCPQLDYALMIDDDVWLPEDADLGIDILYKDPSIVGFSYAITAASSKNEKNLLIELQDVEYKFAGFFKYYQSETHSIAWPHGAISLWRRDALGKNILYNHDTVFHGEDMYMGILMQKSDKNIKLKYGASVPVPTFAPDNLLTLFRQRIKSWDLCNQRKFFVFFQLLFMPKLWYLKPFYFLEVLNIALDWIRPFLIGIGLVYYPFPTLVSFLFFLFITYLLLFIFNYQTLKNRKDIRPTIRAILVYPFYKIFLGLLRFIALLHNVVWYSVMYPNNYSIEVRENEHKNIPPIPFSPKPNWNMIFETGYNEVKSSRTLDTIRKNFNTKNNLNLELFILAYVEFSKLHLFIKENVIKINIKSVLNRQQTILLYKKFHIIDESMFQFILCEMKNNYMYLKTQFEDLIMMEPISFDFSSDYKRWARIFIRTFNNICFYIWQIHNPYSHDKTLHIKQMFIVRDLFIHRFHKFLEPNNTSTPSSPHFLMKKYMNTIRKSKKIINKSPVLSVKNLDNHDVISLPYTVSTEKQSIDNDKISLPSSIHETVLVKFNKRIDKIKEEYNEDETCSSSSDGMDYLRETIYELEDMKEEIYENKSRCRTFTDDDVKSAINSTIFGDIIN